MATSNLFFSTRFFPGCSWKFYIFTFGNSKCFQGSYHTQGSNHLFSQNWDIEWRERDIGNECAKLIPPQLRALQELLDINQTIPWNWIALFHERHGLKYCRHFFPINIFPMRLVTSCNIPFKSIIQKVLYKKYFFQELVYYLNNIVVVQGYKYQGMAIAEYFRSKNFRLPGNRCEWSWLDTNCVTLGMASCTVFPSREKG